MDYVSRQKFNINELVNAPRNQKRVLLVISEEYLREIYCRHLEANDFEVFVSNFGNHPVIARFLNFSDILIIDLKNSEEDDKLDFLKIIAREFPQISVITVGHGLDEKLLRPLMALGVVGHLDRRFSRPQDLIDIAKTILTI